MIITKSEPFTKEEIEKKNKQVLGALALDLKRVALGYFRGSTPMAERFFEEALKRRSEVDRENLKPYLVKFLNNMENLKKEDGKRAAENALLYSTIFQNASTTIS
nr:hypothetical protein [Candidatus Levybacteria bacterium]